KYYCSPRYRASDQAKNNSVQRVPSWSAAETSLKPLQQSLSAILIIEAILVLTSVDHQLEAR
ncbi:MAG TPA: hypothetical protein VFY96_09735, partial [Candidatus Binatia bacterium]|nr:hypothetical protein [Candidatus Binatia bacterium]